MDYRCVFLPESLTAHRPNGTDPETIMADDEATAEIKMRAICCQTGQCKTHTCGLDRLWAGMMELMLQTRSICGETVN